MKVFKLKDVKRLSQLNFDDCIEYENRRVCYTHWIDDQPMFLQLIYNKNTNDWIAQPQFCIKLSNAKTWLETGTL